MYQYRITKYDPQYRIGGAYTRYDWISVSDVGRVFADGLLTRETVDRTIAHYVACALEILTAARIPTLTAGDMELISPDVPWRDGQTLPLPEAGPLLRDCLSERCWCRLTAPEAFVHFGYDLYMYVGCALPPDTVHTISRAHGLFAEEFISPYSEPEAKGAPHA